MVYRIVSFSFSENPISSQYIFVQRIIVVIVIVGDFNFDKSSIIKCRIETNILLWHDDCLYLEIVFALKISA